MIRFPIESRMPEVYLASTSALKKAVVEDLFQFSHFRVRTFSTQGSHIPEQPVNSGRECAQQRLDMLSTGQSVFAIAIENELVVTDTAVFDTAVVCIRLPDGREFSASSSEPYRASIPKDVYDQVRAQAQVTPDGMSLTLGREYFHQQLGYPHDNWHLPYAGFDRKDQILNALLTALSRMLIQEVEFFSDFPKPGVEFQYQGQIWKDPIYLALLNCVTAGKIRHLGLKPDLIAGVDSRGYISGAVLAHLLGVGFVCITKAGKTPGNPKTLEGSTEYSRMEMEVNPAVISGSVLVIDDLVASGGSLLAASSLIRDCGAEICACVSILKVGSQFQDATKKLGMTPVCILE